MPLFQTSLSVKLPLKQRHKGTCTCMNQVESKVYKTGSQKYISFVITKFQLVLISAEKGKYVRHKVAVDLLSCVRVHTKTNFSSC